jgi:hypothetical protein
MTNPTTPLASQGSAEWLYKARNQGWDRDPNLTRNLTQPTTAFTTRFATRLRPSSEHSRPRRRHIPVRLVCWTVGLGDGRMPRSLETPSA